MYVTVLVENTSFTEGLRAEHGLSLYIEANDKKILFDMGQTELFADNAEKLGIHLADVDVAVLSHGHYDHGGGLSKFLEINKKAPVYLSRYAFGAHFHGPERYIGLDAALAQNDRLIYTDDTASIGSGLSLYSCNTCQRSFELGSFGLTLKRGGKFFLMIFAMNNICWLKRSIKEFCLADVPTKVFWILRNGSDPTCWLADSISPNFPLTGRLPDMRNISAAFLPHIIPVTVPGQPSLNL